MAKRQLVGKPTKEKTRAGRTVYITDKDIKDKEGNTFIKKGSRVSEISSTVGPIKGKYYNIPSIHAGKNYTDNELTEAIKNNRLIPTSVHDSITEAEAAAKNKYTQGPQKHLKMTPKASPEAPNTQICLKLVIELVESRCSSSNVGPILKPVRGQS